jgi:hypothetical protein
VEKKLCLKMLVVRLTENLQAVLSSYYSSCPWVFLQNLGGV